MLLLYFVLILISKYNFLFRYLTVNDILEELIKIKVVEAIFIEPPKLDVLSDKHSGNDDGGGFIENIGHWLLNSGGEVILPNNTRIGGSDDPEEEEISDNVIDCNKGNTN